jgi:hypothetical protein
MVFYFEIIENIHYVFTRKVWKNNFCAYFPFYFLYVFLVSENLVSKYEQLLILTDIDGFLGGLSPEAYTEFLSGLKQDSKKAFDKRNKEHRCFLNEDRCHQGRTNLLSKVVKGCREATCNKSYVQG